MRKEARIPHTEFHTHPREARPLTPPDDRPDRCVAINIGVRDAASFGQSVSSSW